MVNFGQWEMEISSTYCNILCASKPLDEIVAAIMESRAL